MKQKKYFILAAAALLMAACSENDIAEKQNPQAQQAGEQVIEFDAYISRGTTRAGDDGVMDNTTLPALTGHGFGVFGYYTNGESYTGSTRPDFFYNQNVDHDGSTWTYSPIKYWPNEFGNDAISDQVDKVTLFAYAPWVPVTPLTGLVTATAPNNAINIIGMTRNNATGDPMIKYVSSLISGNSVDLCYGVAASRFTSSVTSTGQNDIAAGKPYIDVVKPGIDNPNSKIKFDFKHALAQFVVTLDAKVTDLTTGTGNDADDLDKDYTRIWVRSVTFEGITQTGALNLNSEAGSPNWYDVNGTSRITTGSLTVYDGRKDGREANEAASSETPATINPIFVQNKPYKPAGTGSTPDDIKSDGLNDGVTVSPKNLFGKLSGEELVAEDAVNPIFVIPTNEKMKVTIVYDVETADENLAAYLSDGSRKGSTIENRIYKTIEAFGNITAGKKYTLKLHLGMRSVDFDATVTAWDEYESPVDLPTNLQTFAAATTPGAGTITVPAGTTACTFAVSNMVPGQVPAISAKTNSLSDATISAAPADGFGVSVVTISAGIKENTKTINETAGGTVTIASGGKSAVITVNQTAHPIGITSLTVTDKNTLTLEWDTTDPATMDAFNTYKAADKAVIKVYKNSIDITNDCDLTQTNKTIKINSTSELVNTDKVKVVLQANDAPAESKEAVASL